jgi:polygalacturonase
MNELPGLRPALSRLALAGLCLAALALVLPSPARAAAADTCADPPASGPIVNVKDKGAKGDGKTIDNAAIQAAIDAAAGTKGTVLVPAGTYLVETTGSLALRLKSDMTLKLAPGAVLKAKPTDQTNYSVLAVRDASNVWVVGGTLVGERDQHIGKEGQWGMGITIGQGSKHVTVIGVTATRMWGDGFYVQSAEDVRFCSVTADANRRQGLSIIHATNVLVANSVFKNTRGTKPSAGIDLEPNEAVQQIGNVRIQNSKFLNNAGAGIIVSGRKASIAEVAMARNTFEGNDRPIIVANAPGIGGDICGNRQITQETPPSSGFSNSYTEPVANVVLQDKCGDPSLIMRRESKKKNKKH